MKTLLTVLLPLLLTPTVLASSDRYIVVLHNDTPNMMHVMTEHIREHGVSVSHAYGFALKGYAAVIPETRLAALRADSRVAYVAKDHPFRAFAQFLPRGIDRIDAETSPNSNISEPAVAVLDTGVGPHNDLNIVGGVDCQSGISFHDDNGHGTHVAGTIGARDNNHSVIGVHAGARLYSVRVLDNAGVGSLASVICGVDWVAQNAAVNNIKVANMSLGGTGTDGGDCATTQEPLQQAICSATAAGVLFVAAAGNEGVNFNTTIPAAYDQVLTVTAIADFNGAPGGGASPQCLLDVDDTASDTSNFTTAEDADELHTIAAPGVCILSTWPANGTHTISGTSMAAPHVAGAAARCIAKGACTGGPSTIMSTLRGDAAAQPGSYGFVGDPNNPIVTTTTLYYGFLVKGDY